MDTDMIAAYRAQMLKEHLANGGREEDFDFAYRKRLTGNYLFLDNDLREFRDMEAEELEDALEDMQDDLDEAVEAIEAFVKRHGDVSRLQVDDPLLEEYDELLDEQFAVEQSIRLALDVLEENHI